MRESAILGIQKPWRRGSYTQYCSFREDVILIIIAFAFLLVQANSFHDIRESTDTRERGQLTAIEPAANGGDNNLKSRQSTHPIKHRVVLVRDTMNLNNMNH